MNLKGEGTRLIHNNTSDMWRVHLTQRIDNQVIEKVKRKTLRNYRVAIAGSNYKSGNLEWREEREDAVIIKT